MDDENDKSLVEAEDKFKAVMKVEMPKTSILLAILLVSLSNFLCTISRKFRPKGPSVFKLDQKPEATDYNFDLQLSGL